MSPSAAATYSPTTSPEDTAGRDKSSIAVADSEKGDKATPEASDTEATTESNGVVKSDKKAESTKKGKHKNSSDGDVGLKTSEAKVHVDENGGHDDFGEDTKKHKNTER